MARQETGPGSRVYFVPQDPQLRPAGFDTVAMPRHLLTGAQLFARSPRRVVEGWFALHGIPAREEADRTTAQLPGGGTAVVSFDELGRIWGVDVGRLSA